MNPMKNGLAARATARRFAMLVLAALSLLPEARAADSPPAAAAPTLVDVKRWAVEGNTLLPTAEIDQSLAGYTGPATLERLRSAAATVQTLYRRAGYGGVVAFLPEQDLKDGRVLIRVVEGRLARVDIADNKQYSTENIRASLPSLTPGVTPNVRRIDAEIQLANENPSKTVQVLLQPGETPGAIVAAVTVQEQPVQHITARVDNTGGASIGRWRAALGWQHANLAGRDQVLAAEVQTAPQDPSAVRVFSSSYRMPLYGSAMAFDAYGAWSNVDAGKVGTAAGDLAFSGKGSIVGLRLSNYLPRYSNVDQRLLTGFEARTYRNTCTIDGLPQDACGAAGASVAVQPVSLTYTAQAAGEVRWGFSIGLHHNLGSGGAHARAEDFEAVRQGSKRRYTLLRSSTQVALPLGEWASFAARLNAQASSQPLVPGEMFGAGGAASVRGFEERELSGDSGATLSLELQGRNLAGDGSTTPHGADIRLLTFADAGYVQNELGAPCLAGRSHCRMGSLGIGLRANWPSLTLRLDIARAMSTASTTAKGDARAHAGLTYTF